MSRDREIIEDLCRQFAYNAGAGKITTGGLSVLEEAFTFLGWQDPHQLTDGLCDEPGCKERSTCGFPTPSGYRRTCGEHYKP
jgi:hypothetical protein